MKALVKETLTAHQRIIFNGDNYSDEWVKEAERRGLLNLKSLPEAFSHFLDQKNVDLFVKNNIITAQEMAARCEIELETYSKQINIEALTMQDMARKEIIPAVSAFTTALADSINSKRAVSAAIPTKAEEELLLSLSTKLETFCRLTAELHDEVSRAASLTDVEEEAHCYNEYVIPKMNELREVGDMMEMETASEYWPYPSYSELLFSV